MKIAVLYGGVSGEREVSLSSGKGIVEALKRNNHEVIEIDFHPDRLGDVINLDVDLVFIGLHGKHGEDGCIQGLLEMRNIPYVGSDVLSSALAMDKAKAKELFAANDIPIAKSKVFHITNKTTVTDIGNEIEGTFSLPFVIKPNREGSTLGLTIVEKPEMIKEAINKALQSDSSIIVEDYIKGREITVPVLGAIGEEKALPVIEIIPKNELYDYESKYSPGGSEQICPADIGEQATKAAQTYAVLAHQILGCKTYSRVDFIINEHNVPVILEVNTLPGMTSTSLFPTAAKAIGISYEDMIESFVQLSVK